MHRLLNRFYAALYLLKVLMFEQAFKNIDDVLSKEAGCTTELDYTEQTFLAAFPEVR
jgi:hypothetical protein